MIHTNISKENQLSLAQVPEKLKRTKYTLYIFWPDMKKKTLKSAIENNKTSQPKIETKTIICK
jgi:hypothetical protein